MSGLEKNILLFVCSVIPVVFCLAIRFKLSIELLKDIRIERILHYFILFLFGFVLFFKETAIPLEISWELIFKILAFFFCLSYAAVFAIASNNEADLEIDKISNSNRPLVRESIPIKQYRVISYTSLLLALVLSAVLGLPYFMCVIGLSAIYFIYSCKPFRFKRFVIFAKFLIGINTFVCALAGFSSAGGNILDFPLFWTIFILVPIALLANFIDLKDVEGDGKAGIRTIPVIFGEKKAFQFISLCILSCYISVYFYFNYYWFLGLLIPSSIFHLFLLLRKPYNEKPLFYLHNFLFLGLIALLLISK